MVVGVTSSPGGNGRLSHNLFGQRLGRKGRDTRERIIAATQRLLAGPPDKPISLSAVAREASLAMTTLYLYFSDLVELLLAVLEPVTDSAEESHVALLRTRWPDGSLNERCLEFVTAYHKYWVKHGRLLHLRNNFADNHDERMGQHRISSSIPLIKLLIQQMGEEVAMGSAPTSTRRAAMATALVTGVERLITVATSGVMTSRSEDISVHVHYLLEAQARLLALGIREGRKLQPQQSGTAA
jgi:AcrR family transcriptional regulator